MPEGCWSMIARSQQPDWRRTSKRNHCQLEALLPPTLPITRLLAGGPIPIAMNPEHCTGLASIALGPRKPRDVD
jgi:hypothetical protein